MKTIVVYKSATGFTAKYANWIAQELQCEISELKKTNLSSLHNYDMVIYGGWVMGGMVSGYNKIKKLGLKNVVVFCSGMNLPSNTVTESISKQNNIPLEKLFYFEGGYAPEKLGFIKKMMINMIASSINKKDEKSENDIQMLEMVKGADCTKKSAIGPLIEAVKAL